MKKSLLSAILLGIGWVSTSQAVVIHWAAETTVTFTSAQLVYVNSVNVGDVTYITGLLPPVIDTAYIPGDAVSGVGVYDRTAADGITRTDGGYYVVLFNGAQAVQFSSLLAYNDPNAIDSVPMSPGVNVFSPGTAGNPAGGFTPVPEPCTMALLCFGAATVAIRRRWKRRA